MSTQKLDPLTTFLLLTLENNAAREETKPVVTKPKIGPPKKYDPLLVTAEGKTCSICRAFLSHDLFYKNQIRCKFCIQDHYQKNKKKAITQAKERKEIRVAAGWCVWCESPDVLPKSQKCAPCKLKERAYAKHHAEKRKSL
jgi:hypothetical protein